MEQDYRDLVYLYRQKCDQVDDLKARLMVEKAKAAPAAPPEYRGTPANEHWMHQTKRD